MNYKNIYECLISRGKDRNINQCFERHHIIPKCMGGNNKKENIVRLTPEEHYVVHQLLIKIYPDQSKLVFAAHMMTVCSPTQIRNNKEYGWIRRRFLENNKGHNCPSFGKKLSDSHKKRISEANIGKTLTKEHKQIISETHRNKIVSDVTREKMSISQTGKKRSKEFCNNRSEFVTGDKNPMYNNGYKISGNKNGMYGKSAVKGRQWFYNNDEVIYVFPDDERLLNNKWIMGRPTKNKTFVDLYGEEKASIMKQKQSEKATLWQREKQ